MKNPEARIQKPEGRGIKLAWWLALLAAVSCLLSPAPAANILQRGYTFSDNTNDAANIVTSNRLRVLIESATALPAFITNQTITSNNLPTNATAFVFDPGTTNLAQVPIGYLLTTNYFNKTNGALDGGGGAPLAVRVDTNLLLIPTSNNKLTFNTNPPVTGMFSNTDLVWVFNTNSNAWAGATLTNFGRWMKTNFDVQTYFFTTNVALPGYGLKFSNSHALGRLPTNVTVLLNCWADDHGWQATNATLPLSAALMSNSISTTLMGPAYHWAADRTNIYILHALENSESTVWIPSNNPTAGVTGKMKPITTNSWRISIFAQ